MTSIVLKHISAGFTVEVTEEDAVHRLHVTEVKPGGLASAKGKYIFFYYSLSV